MLWICKGPQSRGFIYRGIEIAQIGSGKKGKVTFSADRAEDEESKHLSDFVLELLEFSKQDLISKIFNLITLSSLFLEG